MKTRIPFDEINMALFEKFGSEVVLKPHDKYPYVLSFQNENPSKQTIKLAMETINQFVLSAWAIDPSFYPDEALE